MGLVLLTERRAKQIAGLLSCYDRVIVQGTLPVFCYAEGMTAYLTKRRIRIFDFAQFAKPLTEAIRANAEQLAADNGLAVDYVRKKNFRKEDRVKEVLRERGNHPGLVWIFSALEPCTTYQPWHDKKSGRTYLRPDDGKCLHYYFYFIDEELGLCYLRVPTWCPFRLQFYCNGHNWLARQLDQKKIGYRLLDNAFVAIDDWKLAQQIADSWDPSRLHRKLDEFAARYCPILKQLEESYHWSLDEAEYATDIVFHRQADLQAIYGNLIRTAIHTVKPDDIATFLGKKLNGNYQDEMGNRYNVRIEGTRVRHSMGMASIKMYDKFGHILRIETTTKDVSFFKHYRAVEQRNGESVLKFAPMKKSIYSLGPCGNYSRPLTAAIWSFSRPSTIPATASTSSTRSLAPCTRRRALTGDSTFSITTTKRSFWPWPAGNSPSAGCKTRPCAPTSRSTAAARCPESSAGFAPTRWSKRRPTATSIT